MRSEISAQKAFQAINVEWACGVPVYVLWRAKKAASMTSTIYQARLSTLAALKSPMLMPDYRTTNSRGRDNNHYPAKPIHSDWAETEQCDRIIDKRRSNMINKFSRMQSMFEKREKHNYANVSPFSTFIERHAIFLYRTLCRLSWV